MVALFKQGRTVASFWSGTTAELQASSDADILGRLAQAQMRHFRTSEAQQLRAWTATLELLRPALGSVPGAAGWHVLLEFPMLRLGHRPDVILLTGHAILVLEIKAGANGHANADRRQVEDYGLDLHDFHAGSRTNPVVPILVAEHAPVLRPATMPLPLGSVVSPTLDANARTLPELLRDLDEFTQRFAPRLDHGAWLSAPYAPVPGIVDAARMLYGRHGVDDLRAARSDAGNLRATTAAITAQVAAARHDGAKCILFVTGVPGAGKTLCGLNSIFAADTGHDGTYLTGNPTLVHVLREALVRDAAAAGAGRGASARKMTSVVQALPRFRDHYVGNPAHAPAERVVVIDEAQRSWSASWAIGKTRDKPTPLSRSEPAHLLEIMERHDGFCAVICLVGGGQEIHAGEGGLAEWGEALRQCHANGAAWRVFAPPDLLRTVDPRQRLGPLDGLQLIGALHLDVPIRQIRNALASAWVDHVLAGDAVAAAATAAEAGRLPFVLTRDQAAMRSWLRAQARGLRRAGLVASSGAARLRAEGLGVELPHMDAGAVAHWFLDRFPNDVRASDALEVVATEFSCQGLELDYVGMCWDLDLVREAERPDWRPRSFRGTGWQAIHKPDLASNQLNTYRVLLTRARYETIIFVPPGSDADATRSPARYDLIAAFLTECGVPTLSGAMSLPATAGAAAHAGLTAGRPA